MLPLSMGSKPAITLNKVVLPDPEAPRSVQNSPSLTYREILFSAMTLSNFFSTFLITNELLIFSVILIFPMRIKY